MKTLFRIILVIAVLIGIIIACKQKPSLDQPTEQDKEQPAKQPNKQHATTKAEQVNKTGQHKYSNHLINEKSPYLLQHAHNPVDWYPWGKEAFTKAKQENKPIFLSIGYATCHWCHVMERESFENDEIANYLNEHYICIKVDREERPDVDAIYMEAIRQLGQNGGWPLSAFLTPDKDCFYVGTYFRPTEFKELCTKVKEVWAKQPDELLQQAKKLTNFVKLSLIPDTTQQVELNKDIIHQIDRYYQKTFDHQYGGIKSHSTKFPTAHRFSLLLRHAQRTGDTNTLNFVETSLEAIWKGGIHDHLGGGFHRYSTDPMWLVPHFEKMLYDQALLATAYVEAFQLTGKPFYADAANDIFDYVLRKMTHSKGGFFSAEDADSEGIEGKFYHWTKNEILTLLGAEKGERFCTLYNIKEKGNFKDPHTPNDLYNILHLTENLETVAQSLKIDPTEFKKEIDASKEILFEQRFKRIHPLQDIKIITAWNGLMISALSKGARALNNPRLSKAAEKAAHFVLGQLQKEGRLLRRFCDGESNILGYLDDYAFFVHGLIDLYQVNFDPNCLKEASRLTNDMTRLFGKGDGALLFSGTDDEQLIADRKSSYDGALPSGNSIAALNYLRLGHIKADEILSQKGVHILNDFSITLRKHGASHTQLAIALDYHLGPRQEIVIAGEMESETARTLIRSVNKFYLPRSIVLFRHKERPFATLEQIPYIKEQKMLKNKTTVYVCNNYTCHLPVSTTEELEKLLKKIQK